jgi:glycine/D-amino acid oxidase-like deaminating enzyme/nitrite reductase/ring-hydroxylating ferredoxin subunit
MKRQPPWTVNVQMPAFQPLREDARAEVCVVGGGISGLTTAYLLCLAGKSVILLEDGELGSGMTGATTAHLTCALDHRYVEIERLHGGACARIAAQSHAAAINRIDAIATRERIDCDFERLTGYLFEDRDQPAEVLAKELEAARRAGIRDAVMIPRAPIERFDTGPCIAFPNQAQVHPLKYLAGVARAIKRNGGRIFTKTHVDSVEGGADARVRAGERTVSCEAIVVATNTPINDLVAIHTKQAPYMSYVIGARVPRGSVHRALYWDTRDDYHYVRVHEVDGNDILIVGGEDHKSGQADDTNERHERLEAWARERFPVEQVEYAWAGQIMQTIDRLAFIGRNPLDHDNVYVVTGDSGTGMTHGTIAGILITDLILDRRNPWEKIYDPARKTIRAAGTFVKEAANMAAQYADWAKAGEVSSEGEIPNGHGAILRHGVHIIAAYRDDQGRLHERSAVCPHLGCIVHWNAAESSWDCPCHGSRFDKTGKVINGPANRDLALPGAGKMRTG